MDARQKFLEDNEYFLTDEFSEFVRSMYYGLAEVLGEAIDNTIYQIGYGMDGVQEWGIHVDFQGETYYFCILIDRVDENMVGFIDMKFIDVDKYLDLINLNRQLNESLEVIG